MADGTADPPALAKADGFEIPSGHIELDEAYVGGHRPGKRGRGAAGKTIVIALKERAGRIAAQVIPDIKKATLQNVVARHVEPGATVSTDELVSYGLLEGDGYAHGVVKHGTKEWSYYDYRSGATHHTNHVENFWALFKHSVRGTHIHISTKHMPKYLGSSLIARILARCGMRCSIILSLRFEKACDGSVKLGSADWADPAGLLLGDELIQSPGS